MPDHTHRPRPTADQQRIADDLSRHRTHVNTRPETLTPLETPPHVHGRTINAPIDIRPTINPRTGVDVTTTNGAPPDVAPPTHLHHH